MDREAWTAKSWTRLKQLSRHIWSIQYTVTRETMLSSLVKTPNDSKCIQSQIPNPLYQGRQSGTLRVYKLVLYPSLPHLYHSRHRHTPTSGPSHTFFAPSETLLYLLPWGASSLGSNITCPLTSSLTT